MWNIVSSMIYQIVSIVCGLIVPRLILRTFGSTYNGVAESAMQFLSMVTVLNVGIAGATRVAFYQTLANGDELGTSRIYKSNKQYMHKVAGVIVGYAVVLMAIYPYVSHNDLAHWECSLLIGIVSIRTFGEYFFGISNRTLLDADFFADPSWRKYFYCKTGEFGRISSVAGDYESLCQKKVSFDQRLRTGSFRNPEQGSGGVSFDRKYCT